MQSAKARPGTWRTGRDIVVDVDGKHRWPLSERLPVCVEGFSFEHGHDVHPSYHDYLELCWICEGRGRVFTPEVVTGELEIALRKLTADRSENELLLKVHPAVALHLMEQEYSLLQQLESHTHTRLHLRDDPLMRLDDFVVFSLPSKRKLEIK